MIHSNIELCSWEEALTLLQNVQPDLYAAFASVPFPKKAVRPTFIKITYRYADEIAKQGVFNTSLLCGKHSQTAKEQLNYASIPLGIPLDKSIAVDSMIEETPILATLVCKGHIFGVFETLDAVSGLQQGDPPRYAAWDVTAGTRSVFIHWPMGDKYFLKRIVESPPSEDNPRQFPTLKAGQYLHSMDWRIVKYIDTYRNAAPADCWQCDVLFVPKEVFEPGRSIYSEVVNYLYRYGWKQSGVVRKFNKFVDNQALSLWEACKKKKSSLPKTAMPLFWLFARMSLVTHGIRPGFCIVKAGGSDALGPFAYTLERLNRHASDWAEQDGSPIIFEPCYLNDENSRLYMIPFEPTAGGRLDPRSAPEAYSDLISILNELVTSQRTIDHLEWIKSNTIRFYKANDSEGKYVASDQSDDEVTNLSPNTKEKFFKVIIGIERNAQKKGR